MELIVIYILNQTNINQGTLSFRNSWTYVSRSFQTQHFTMWNGNIHLFHKIVILGVVSWNLQNLKRGVCFCQDFVWCLCKKGNCQLFFNDWKGGPTSPRLQEQWGCPQEAWPFCILIPWHLNLKKKKNLNKYI